MKILHINCNYLTTALHQTMMEHLEKKGGEHMVFAPTYSLERAVITPRKNVIARSCFRRRDRVLFHYKQSKIRKCLEKNIKVSDYDCIHAYTVFTDGNLARVLSRKYGIPYVVAVRSTDVNAFFKRMVHLRGLGVRILADAAAVFFLSEAYRAEVMEKYVPAKYRDTIAKKTYIIGNGIDDFWFQNPPPRNLAARLDRIANRELRVLYVGRINNNKNPMTTVKALEILRGKGWKTKFCVVGKAEDEALHKQLQGMPDTVCIPQQPKEKLLDFYRDNDFFVMPSHSETFGLVYAEAMSQGLPVLYTRGQGFDGQVPDGEAGYAIDDHDPGDVADKLEKLADRYGELSPKAEELSCKFVWEKICLEYIEIYGKITGK